ncbi:MAG: hypothetical protein K5985_02040 [Lachnospiraceae bacterium]|nr:hypothetical protein [Lachnospiraceae bacterium]
MLVTNPRAYKLIDYLLNEALDGFLQDALNAEKELTRVRDLDLDSEEMFIMNSCNENAYFTRLLQEKFVTDESHLSYYYETVDYMQENPEAVLQFIDKNYEQLADAADINEAGKRKGREIINELKQKSSGAGFEKGDLKKLKNLAAPLSKYEFHKAANICRVGDKVYTTEGYAAETSQFMKAPVTMHGGVGVYRSSKEDVKMDNTLVNDGMKGFYLKDNPFGISRIDAIRIALKPRMLRMWEAVK